MKKLSFMCVCAALAFAACTSNPLTGQKSVSVVNKQELFQQSFTQYQEFLDQSVIVEKGSDAEMVQRIGDRIKAAAEKWYIAEGQPDYLKDYRWEYHLVQSDEINAWCMPGGKIVVYTGILPVTKTEDALAVVLGHEVSHALLNHGEQGQNINILQQVGASGVALMTSRMSETSQQVAQTVYSAGSNVGGVLPFDRKQETEADRYGLSLMAIAGYNPDEAVPFWERMASLGGSTPELLSTHPSDATRIKNIQGWLPEAKQKAAELNR